MQITEWKRGHAEAIYRALKAWSPASEAETNPAVPNMLTGEQQVILQDRRREALDHWALVIARHKVKDGERWVGANKREMGAMAQATEEAQRGQRQRQLAQLAYGGPTSAFNPPRITTPTPAEYAAAVVKMPVPLPLNHRKQQVHHALRQLAGMCDGANKLDGVGFSKNDAEDGHALARSEPGDWNTVDWAQAQRFVRKYRRQLEGVDLPDDLRQPLSKGQKEREKTKAATR